MVHHSGNIVESFYRCISACMLPTCGPLLQVADDRPTRFPVTFALQVVMLREHNRCCGSLASEWGPSDDEVCWTAPYACISSPSID